MVFSQVLKVILVDCFSKSENHSIKIKSTQSKIKKRKKSKAYNFYSKNWPHISQFETTTCGSYKYLFRVKI